MVILLVTHLSPAFAGSDGPPPKPATRRRRNTLPPKACDEDSYYTNLCFLDSNKESCSAQQIAYHECQRYKYVMSNPKQPCYELSHDCLPLNTDNGMSPEMNLDACAEAANVYNRPFLRESVDARNNDQWYPKGCYVYSIDEKFYYNEGTVGQPQALSTQVCVCKIPDGGSSGGGNGNNYYVSGDGGSYGGSASSSFSTKNKPALIAGIVVCAAIVVGIAGYIHKKDSDNQNIEMVQAPADAVDTGYVLMEDKDSTKTHPRVVAGTHILEQEFL